MPPGHIGPPGKRGERSRVRRLCGSMRSTQAVVASPIWARSAEWVSRYTWPGSPSTVMVESVVLRVWQCRRSWGCSFQSQPGAAVCRRAGPPSSAGQGLP